MKTFREFVGGDINSRAIDIIKKVILHDHHYADDNGSTFHVWRLGTSGDLTNRNAGDLLGVAKFSSSDDAEFSATGGMLYVFQVSNPSKQFGPYQRFRRGGALAKDVSSIIGRSKEKINWGIGRDYVHWYSFPEGGDWSAHVVKKIPMATLNQRAKSLGTYIGDSELVDAVIFYEAATGKTLL